MSLIHLLSQALIVGGVNYPFVILFFFSYVFQLPPSPKYNPNLLSHSHHAHNVIRRKKHMRGSSLVLMYVLLIYSDI